MIFVGFDRWKEAWTLTVYHEELHAHVFTPVATFADEDDMALFSDKLQEMLQDAADGLTVSLETFEAWLGEREAQDGRPLLVFGSEGWRELFWSRVGMMFLGVQAGEELIVNPYERGE